MSKVAPRNTRQAMAFLRAQHDQKKRWHQRCLQLQREARGLPPVYPTALSAALNTPASERIKSIKDLRRGMVAYFDDPHDKNPAGHIVGVAGWIPGKPKSNPDNLLTWSNDVRSGSGDVGLVGAGYFPKHWGDGFLFGSTWLNGYDFSEFDKAPRPTHPTLGANYEAAMESMAKTIAYHKKKGHTALVRVLNADLAHMKKMHAQYS